jgi:hypothetical protein
MLSINRVAKTDLVHYSMRGILYRVADLKIGTVMTYDSTGYGNCSKVPYVVVETFKKRSDPNKGYVNEAIICPITDFTEDTVTYDSSKEYTIKLIFKTFGVLRLEGWHFENSHLGHFLIDKIECDDGIIKG